MARHAQSDLDRGVGESREEEGRRQLTTDHDAVAPKSASPGGLVYGALAAEQLLEAETIKASLEARAIKLVSTAGSVVTIALAIAAFAKDGDTFRLPDVARVFVGVAVLCFAGSLYFAFEILRPSSHTNATTEALEELIEDDWDESEDVATRRVAKLRAETLVEIRERNGEKADNLHRLVTGELVAVGMLAFAVVSALIDR